MLYMSNVLDDDGIPANAGVAIEYRIPQTSKRVDFIVTGRNGNDRGAAVIVELKQWSDVEATDKDGIVKHVRRRGGPRGAASVVPGLDLCRVVARLQRERPEGRHRPRAVCVSAQPGVRRWRSSDPRYLDHLNKAPTVRQGGRDAPDAFIKQHIKHGDDRRLLFQIENSRIRPSKNLADELASLLKGNQEFMMIDDQKVVFETAIATGRRLWRQQAGVDRRGRAGHREVRGRGELLVRLTERQLLPIRHTQCRAPGRLRERAHGIVQEEPHHQSVLRVRCVYRDGPNTFDGLIVDEAHRLNERSASTRTSARTRSRRSSRRRSSASSSSMRISASPGRTSGRRRRSSAGQRSVAPRSIASSCSHSSAATAPMATSPGSTTCCRFARRPTRTSTASISISGSARLPTR